MNVVLKGKGNVYEQIVNEYKKYISLNILKQGEKLPSCRILAKELGVNPNTVDRAYKKLEEDGYIKALPKKGVYVDYIQHKNAYLEEAKKTIKLLKKDIDYEQMIEIVNQIYKEGEK